MKDHPRPPLAFHWAATLLLQLCLLAALGLFVFYIAPGIDIEFEDRAMTFGVTSELVPVVLVFAICCTIAFGILGWRLWLSRRAPRGEPR